jgi:hypothetical protein
MTFASNHSLCRNPGYSRVSDHSNIVDTNVILVSKKNLICSEKNSCRRHKRNMKNLILISFKTAKYSSVLYKFGSNTGFAPF